MSRDSVIRDEKQSAVDIDHLITALGPFPVSKVLNFDRSAIRSIGLPKFGSGAEKDRSIDIRKILWS